MQMKQGLSGDWHLAALLAEALTTDPTAGGFRVHYQPIVRFDDTATVAVHPEKGLLGYENMAFTVIQYWRSFEHPEAFAKNTDDPHLDVWRSYWRRVGKSTRTGIWHETYLVRAGEYEAIYGNMPPHELGKAATLVPAAESVGASGRLKAVSRG